MFFSRIVWGLLLLSAVGFPAFAGETASDDASETSLKQVENLARGASLTEDNGTFTLHLSYQAQSLAEFKVTNEPKPDANSVIRVDVDLIRLGADYAVPKAIRREPFRTKVSLGKLKAGRYVVLWHERGGVRESKDTIKHDEARPVTAFVLDAADKRLVGSRDVLTAKPQNGGFQLKCSVATLQQSLTRSLDKVERSSHALRLYITQNEMDQQRKGPPEDRRLVEVAGNLASIKPGYHIAEIRVRIGPTAEYELVGAVVLQAK